MRGYLVMFQNNSPMDAKWMNARDLAHSPEVLKLYLKALGLDPTLERAPNTSSTEMEYESGALPIAFFDSFLYLHIYFLN